MYSDYPKAESKRCLLEMTSSALSICESICPMKYRVNRTTAKLNFTMKETEQREKPSWQLHRAARASYLRGMPRPCNSSHT